LPVEVSQRLGIANMKKDQGERGRWFTRLMSVSALPLCLFNMGDYDRDNKNHHHTQAEANEKKKEDNRKRPNGMRQPENRR